MEKQATAPEHFDKLKLRWERDQITSVLYGNALGAVIGNLVNISLVGYLLLKIYPDSWLPLWFASGLAINCFRFVLYIVRKRNPGALSIYQWLLIYRVTTLASGLHFGLLALFFFSSEVPIYQTLVACFIAGSVAAAVATHGVDVVTYRLFLFPAATPLLVRVALEGSETYTALAVMIFFLMVVMNRCANQAQKTMLENIQMSYSLNYRATHDSLVALFNREEFQNEFDKTISNAANLDKTVAMIFIDLDNFKQVNDNHGHDVGDEALIRVSEIIRGSIRKSDIAARFGGDEFMLLLYVDSLDEVAIICDTIFRAIERSKSRSGESDYELGASLGVGHTKDHSVTFKALLKAADRACYKAKKQGKGQVCFAEVAPADRVI